MPDTVVQWRKWRLDPKGRTCATWAGLGARLPDVDFDRLIERARSQRAELEPFHTQAAREAFA